MLVKDNEYLDFSRIPESKGIPKGLLVLVVFTMVCIFAIGGSVVVLSGYGHHWPADRTLRVPLVK